MKKYFWITMTEKFGSDYDPRVRRRISQCKTESVGGNAVAAALPTSCEAS
jgi:hypothetical protein